MNRIVSGQMFGMYVMGENPAMSDPDQNHTLDGLVKLEHLVVQDIFMTETAWFADVNCQHQLTQRKLEHSQIQIDKYKWDEKQ